MPASTVPPRPLPAGSGPAHASKLLRVGALSPRTPPPWPPASRPRCLLGRRAPRPPWGSGALSTQPCSPERTAHPAPSLAAPGPCLTVPESPPAPPRHGSGTAPQVQLVGMGCLHPSSWERVSAQGSVPKPVAPTPALRPGPQSPVLFLQAGSALGGSPSAFCWALPGPTSAWAPCSCWGQPVLVPGFCPPGSFMGSI